MNTSLFQRRRIERFAQLVDEASGGKRHRSRSSDDEQLRDLVGLTGRLSDLPLSVEVHAEFREGLRSMLMATIEREGIGATAEPDSDRGKPDALTAAAALREQRRTRRRTRTLGALVAGLAAGALAISGFSLASDDSLPGEPLYGFKRQTERAQLAWSGSDTSRGQLYLEFARTRLDEARAVRDDAKHFDDVLDEMDLETREGVKLLTTVAVGRRDGAALGVIDDFVGEQLEDLNRLLTALPNGNRDRTVESVKLLNRIVERSRDLRPLLPCGTAAVGDPDDLGPTPGSGCDAKQQEDAGASRPRDGATGTPAPTTSQRGGASSQPTVVVGSGQSQQQNNQQNSGVPPAPSASSGPPLDSGSGITGSSEDIMGGLPNP